MSRNKKTANKYYKEKSNNPKDMKGRDFDESEKSDQPTRSRTNDPFWYAVDPALLRDSASVPWVAAAGTKQSLSSDLMPDHRTALGDFKARLNQSGIQIIKLAPTIGLNQESSSPVNVAMNSLYTKVRYQNSGHANYDAPDLMLYCLAMSEIYSYLNWLIRLYGMAALFTQRNRFVPEHLFAGEGVSYESIKHNLASFRYGINLLIAKAASLCVPANYTLFARRAFVYQGLYTEGTSMKDQLYMYSPDGFYSYALDEDGAGMLEYTTKFGRLAEEQHYTYDQLLNDVNGMLQKIIESEDCQIMSGDILKAFGDNGVLKLGTLGPDYQIVPTFDIAVLEQMKNATIYSGYVNGNDITQDASKGYLECMPSVAVVDSRGSLDPGFLALAPIITTSTADPSPEVTMENSRLITPIYAAQEPVKVGDTYYYELDLLTGTEIPVDLVHVCWLFTDDDISIHYPGRGYIYTELAQRYDPAFSRPNSMNLYETLASMMNFKFTPGVWLGYSEADGIEPGVAKIRNTYAVDLDNFTVQSNDVIGNLHMTAIMSELNTPAINRLS